MSKLQQITFLFLSDNLLAEAHVPTSFPFHCYLFATHVAQLA